MANSLRHLQQSQHPCPTYLRIVKLSGFESEPSELPVFSFLPPRTRTAVIRLMIKEIHQTRISLTAPYVRELLTSPTWSDRHLKAAAPPWTNAMGLFHTCKNYRCSNRLPRTA